MKRLTISAVDAATADRGDTPWGGFQPAIPRLETPQDRIKPALRHAVLQ